MIAQIEALYFKVFIFHLHAPPVQYRGLWLGATNYRGNSLQLGAYRIGLLPKREIRFALGMRAQWVTGSDAALPFINAQTGREMLLR